MLLLEEELKRTKGVSHDLSQKMDAKISEVHALKMKNKWAVLITTYTIQEAFPHNTDACIQTDVVLQHSVAINTEMPQHQSEAVRHWGQVISDTNSHGARCVQHILLDCHYKIMPMFALYLHKHPPTE